MVPGVLPQSACLSFGLFGQTVGNRVDLLQFSIGYHQYLPVTKRATQAPFSLNGNSFCWPLSLPPLPLISRESRNALTAECRRMAGLEIAHARAAFGDSKKDTTERRWAAR